MITLKPESPTPLISQIIDGVRELVASHALKPGAKVPSIRAFAARHSVSVFTVVEAYDRLVAQGVLVSRANQGFFVCRRDEDGPIAQPVAVASSGIGATRRPSFNDVWYLQQIFENRTLPMKPGCGWLPNDWLFEDAVRRSFRQVAAEGLRLGGYGDPMGHLPLRTHIAHSLEHKQQILVRPAQVLLSHGSSQALDWAVRSLVKPGDTVLVDNPGYPNLMNILRFQGARLLGVPRTPSGYDLEELQRLLHQHRPRVFFTQPRLQSPSGSRASLSQLHRLLQMASQYALTLVENDLYADMDDENQPSLASLDQLQRVVYVGSFSKTISPNLRVGFMLANPDWMARLAHLKMLSGLTSSEVAEKLVYNVVTDGRWRKHLKSLRDRLKAGHEEVSLRLHSHGFEPFYEPNEGMYIWARHPAVADSAELASAATAEGIMFGPGQLFLVDGAPTGWLRFNVAYSQDRAIWDWLERYLHHPGARNQTGAPGLAASRH